MSRLSSGRLLPRPASIDNLETGKDNGTHVDAICLQSKQHIDSTHAGHAKIEQHDIGKDSSEVSATLDDKRLAFQSAYSFARMDLSTFVGFYADLSRNAPGARHTIKLHLSGIDPAQLQGVLFDNVEPELTESILPCSIA